MEDLQSTLTPPVQESAKYGRLVSCVPNLESAVIKRLPFKVGRSKNCDVVILNQHLPSNIISSISKEHFVLSKDPGSKEMYLTDLSKNGTFVNDERVGKNAKRAINDGAKIAFGQLGYNIFIFRNVLIEDLPNTLSPLSVSDSEELRCRVMPVWGRLISYRRGVQSLDLSRPVLKVGRSLECDVITDQLNVQDNVKRLFSKEHFSICKDPDNLVAYITDHSKFGTYLNGRLVGKGNMNILQDNDVISVGGQRIELYAYKRMYSQDQNDLPLELRERYEPTIVLGKGGAGEVRLAYEKCSCKMYAIKKILKARSTASQIHKMNHPSKIESEINILRNLSHPFVINMKEIVETPDEVFLVLEYMKGGELTNRILSNVPLTESNIKVLFYQMVLAVEFLHRAGITHRDLKPENVLLASDDADTLIKVSDFGLSKVTEDDGMMQTVCGTLHYIAPEVLYRLDSKIQEYNKQVDIWSLGVILFYMLSKRLPFISKDKRNLMELIKQGDYQMGECWNNVSRYGVDLVQKMLVVEPKKRITITEILGHPWLAKDTAIQDRVQALLERSLDPSEEIVAADPPSKRSRLSESEDSSY